MGIVRVRVYVLCLVFLSLVLVAKLLSWDLLLHDTYLYNCNQPHLVE
jgi:hypothetical protein